MAKDDELFYRLDNRDRIVEVGGDLWDDYARANDGDRATWGHIEGTQLYAHVTGEASRLFVWTMLDAARKLRRPTTRPYRCDTPGLKRFMEMSITPETDGGLVLTHRLIRTEALVKPIAFRVGSPAHALCFRCSMCNRVHVKGTWLEPEVAALDAAGAPSLNAAVRVAYSICPDCQSTAHQPPGGRSISRD